MNFYEITKMRLTKQEIISIKETFTEVFGDGKIYLFGSRVDDNLKGGDIDLYIRLEYSLNVKERLSKKSKFRIKLEDKIGEQKIDIIISKDIDSSIEKEAIKTGVIL
jgi:predicted nucleotidyltransferase